MKTIQAAGGLLWRVENGGVQIALVYRPRYEDWSLPKGKLKSDETWLQAALREVSEETGWYLEAGGFAGAIAYTTEKRLKVVRYWHMLAVRPGAMAVDSEVSVLAWLPLGEARRRVLYDLERTLLEVWDGPDQPTER